MGLKGLSRVIRMSLIAALLMSAAAWPLAGTAIALGIAIGGTASAVNLWLLKGLIQEFLGRRRPLWLALFAQLKIPLFYGVGILVCLTVSFSMLSAIVAFQIPFAFAIVESIRRQNEPETNA